jgi:hypothetical protein
MYICVNVIHLSVPTIIFCNYFVDVILFDFRFIVFPSLSGQNHFFVNRLLHAEIRIQYLIFIWKFKKNQTN